MTEAVAEERERAPRRGLRNDQLSGLMLVAFALFLAWANLDYPVGSLHEPGPGYLPLLLAIFLGSMGLIVAAAGGSSPLLAAMKWVEARRAAVILALCAGAAFALERIGYRLTVIALLIVLLGIVERRRPLMVALVSVGFSLLSYYIVGDLLLVPLPRGPWGF